MNNNLLHSIVKCTKKPAKMTRIRNRRTYGFGTKVPHKAIVSGYTRKVY